MMRTIVTILTFLATLVFAQGQTKKDNDNCSQEQLLQDYDYFFSQLEQIHPDPYSAFGGKDGFGKAVKQLRDKLINRATLSTNEMQAEVTSKIQKP